MIDLRKCKYCNFEMEGTPFQLANHERWCENNPRYDEIKQVSAKRIAEAARNRVIERNGEVKEFIVTCHSCAKEFFVKEAEKLHPIKEKYFCCRSCANKRNHSEITKTKIQIALSKEKQIKECPVCKNEFSSKSNTCSKSCSLKLRYKDIDRTSLKYYRTQCSFNFNLKDYPEEFDFSLIEQFGWYKAKNRGDNLNGVSRDHMVSVKYGHENGIDPTIIAHPANCRLVRHNDNVSKGLKNSISLDQLLEKIDAWNKQYGL